MPDDTSLPYEPRVQRVLQSRDQTRAYYNKIAQFYDFLAESSEGPMRDKGLKLLAPAPGEKVLEIGFGTGHCLVQLAQAVGEKGKVYGLDISDKMVELATKLLADKQLAGRAELARGDGDKLPYPDQSLDAVFTSFTLELFDTPQIPVVLQECLRILKPGGRFGVVAVSHEGKESVMLDVYEWTHKHFPNLMDCRPIYTRRALEAAGFTIRTSDTEMMWVPVEIVIGVKPV